ncbi:MAG: DotU family type IV/VI secretion system protein [Campylobacteraceae bacterium]|nr:DotU family type IV/VI secretion system protein [Campylobacteraceae bacterium]
MDNKTILIPSSSSTDDKITNFTSEEKDYSSFKENKVSFVKNERKVEKKIYSNEDLNYIITSASLVFKQLRHIQNSYDLGSVHDVRQEFIDNINIFTNSLSTFEIEESEVLVSRYLLCTLVDELVNTTFFGRDNDWSSNSLLNIFHNESYGGENFFKLLDKFLKAPAKFIYLLEFMYVCLSLGFEGKYRIDNTKKHELIQIKESLYKQIKIIQGKESLKFYKKQKASKLKHRLFYMISYPSVIVATFCLMLVIYIGLSYSLNEQNISFSQGIEKNYKKLDFLNDKNFILEKYVKAIHE